MSKKKDNDNFIIMKYIDYKLHVIQLYDLSTKPFIIEFTSFMP